METKRLLFSRQNCLKLSLFVTSSLSSSSYLTPTHRTTPTDRTTTMSALLIATLAASASASPLIPSPGSLTDHLNHQRRLQVTRAANNVVVPSASASILHQSHPISVMNSLRGGSDEEEEKSSSPSSLGGVTKKKRQGKSSKKSGKVHEAEHADDDGSDEGEEEDGGAKSVINEAMKETDAAAALGDAIR